MCLPLSLFFALSLPLWARYFTKDGMRGVCIFSRRQTSEHGQRGFRLSSLGVLLARSMRPRPWRHVPALKALVRELQSGPSTQDGSSLDIWAPARQFFELRKARSADPGDAGAWHRWSEELDFDIDDGGVEDGGDGEVGPTLSHYWLRFPTNSLIANTRLSNAPPPPPFASSWTFLAYTL